MILFIKLSHDISFNVIHLLITVDAQAYVYAYYGEGFGPILLDQVICTGDETNFLHCPHINQAHCDHSSDSGVDCIGE